MSGRTQYPTLGPEALASVVETEGLQALTVISPISPLLPVCLTHLGRSWGLMYQYDGADALVSLYLSI